MRAAYRHCGNRSDPEHSARHAVPQLRYSAFPVRSANGPLDLEGYPPGLRNILRLSISDSIRHTSSASTTPAPCEDSSCCETLTHLLVANEARCTCCCSITDLSERFQMIAVKSDKHWQIDNHCHTAIPGVRLATCTDVVTNLLRLPCTDSISGACASTTRTRSNLAWSGGPNMLRMTTTHCYARLCSHTELWQPDINVPTGSSVATSFD